MYKHLICLLTANGVRVTVSTGCLVQNVNSLESISVLVPQIFDGNYRLLCLSLLPSLSLTPGTSFPRSSSIHGSPCSCRGGSHPLGSGKTVVQTYLSPVLRVGRRRGRGRGRADVFGFPVVHGVIYKQVTYLLISTSSPSPNFQIRVGRSTGVGPSVRTYFERGGHWSTPGVRRRLGTGLCATCMHPLPTVTGRSCASSDTRPTRPSGTPRYSSYSGCYHRSGGTYCA